MTKPLYLPGAAALALAACAAHAAAASPARPGEQPLPGMLAVTVPASAGQASLALNPPPLPFSRSRPHRPKSRGAFSVEAAKRAATQEPSRERYLNAVQVYPWLEGTLYRLYTAPEQVSDIALQPGEILVSVAAGDTVRWVIGDTTSGAGAARRVHVLVKPSAAALATNLVIATDRRVYHVELESEARAAMASISWTYPDDALLAVRGAGSAAEGAQVAEGLDVERLNFGYLIDGDRPPWRPVRAFDDGRQVFIEFPPTLAGGEAPPLFVRGEGGQAELVNYRLHGRYYVVDRLFAAAELRLGKKHQQVVRILRGDESSQRRGRGKRS